MLSRRVDVEDSCAVGEARIEEQIFGLLQARRAGASICPSEVARSLVQDGKGWRSWMPAIRQVAQALQVAGRLQVTRGDQVVDATSRGGPIRLRPRD